MSRNLTNRQMELLSFLREYSKQHKLMPTTREIQEHFGFSSQTAAMGHLRALERKGLIVRHPNRARAVVLTEFNDSNEAGIPTIPVYENLIPNIMLPESAKQAVTSVALDVTSLGKRQSTVTFGYKVDGSTMSDAAIREGDILICEPSIPEDKDVVVVKVGNKSVVKRFVCMMGTSFLMEENPKAVEPFPSSDAIIQGVVIAVLRDMKK